MLGSEGNENGEKTKTTINKKSNFARAALFFVHSFAVVLHDTQHDTQFNSIQFNSLFTLYKIFT